MTRPRLRLLPAHAARVARAVALGHPWIYDRALPPVAVAAGTVAAIDAGPDLGAIGCGFVDPDAPIRVRVLARDPDQAIDDDFCRARAERAARRRIGVPALAGTDAVRAIHGENDGLPGLTVDLYAGTAVVVFDGGAAAALWRPRLPAILAGLADGGLIVRARWVRGVRGVKGGGEGDGGPEVEIREHGARFVVDVRAGQKTGFFLDQRGNRAYVAALAGGARVLNLFAYTGGFSIACGRARARSVTSVDIAPAAIAAAERHWRANGLPPDRHQAVTADCFEFLAQAAAAGRRWDVVVVDPPSFAASEAARPAALAAYQRLNLAAAAVVADGGVLVAASCSSHVTEADLRGVLAAVARDGRCALPIIVPAARIQITPPFPDSPKDDISRRWSPRSSITRSLAVPNVRSPTPRAGRLAVLGNSRLTTSAHLRYEATCA
ncbi:MAG: class I SAM-dependent rRNA methyltransferase [Myxococcales bacterium]|nr:class I SAM-dependent rRNA methyltransferase [Myxococcales bacterium]